LDTPYIVKVFSVAFDSISISARLDVSWQATVWRQTQQINLLPDQFINDQANNLAKKGAFWHF
jgi:hypothetical protein